MGKQKSNWLKIFGALVIVIILGVIIAHFVIKSKIENALSTKLPETLQLTYGELNISLLKSQIRLGDVELTNFGKTVKKQNVHAEIEEFTIKGFSYWNFLINELIQVNDVFLDNPRITYYHNPTIPKEEYKAPHKKNLDKPVEIKEFRLNNGFIKVLDSETDSLNIHIEQINLTLEEIIYNEETKFQKIPFKYGEFEMFFNSFFSQLGNYEHLTIKQGKLSNDATELTSLRLYTKYTEEKLSRIIPFERDHFNLQIDSLSVVEHDFSIVEDTIWQFTSSKLAFYQPNFKVYHDKLVSDDARLKPLYSKMLRDLKFKLNLERVFVHDGDIIYSEKVHANRKAGEITFSKFNAEIKNVSNTNQSPTKTILNFDMLFMKHAPLKVVWSFDVNNLSDLFEFQAEIGLLQARYLNTFTEPNLNVRLEGELDKTYFTISGTENKSTIDFKVKYKDFDFTALKDNGTEKNKLLTDVVKLFVNKSSQSKKHPYKEAVKHNIERNKTKSVFNFIWISARAGLLKTMTLE